MVSISHICVHQGEEPVLSGGKGIVNIFFTGCNMRCVYCQNYQISRVKELQETKWDYVGEIIKFLDCGYDTIGLVSPSHCISGVKEIIEELHLRGYHPTVVYNSNGYDRVEKLKEIEGLVDVYLPDFKYSTNELGFSLSKVKNYYDVAIKAIGEMYRQKGSMLIRDEHDKAISGLIIRHLVLPGYVANSLSVLDIIADDISTSVHISLMSQYNPIDGIDTTSSLARRITSDEYEQVKRHFDDLGFHKGWFQELDSASLFNPDFESEAPFGDYDLKK